MEILQFIPTGYKNAVSMRELACRLEISERQLRKEVQKARLNGAPICSACNNRITGYFLPQSVGEAEIYLREEERRLRTAAQSLKPVRDYIAAKKDELFDDDILSLF